MKFNKKFDNGEIEISLTKMSEIKAAVKDGIPLVVGRIPIRSVSSAIVEYIYNEPDMQDRYGERITGWLVDLGTDGIAGHGYDGEEHLYFCPCNTMYDKYVMFQCPANIREGD